MSGTVSNPDSPTTNEQQMRNQNQMRMKAATTAALALAVTFAIAIVIVAPSPAFAITDAECGPGQYGDSTDPRVPLTGCTPWPKPTFAEWSAGWKWAPPATPIGTLPVALSPSPTAPDGVAVTVCAINNQSSSLPPCVGVDPNLQTVRLDYWCQRLRDLGTVTLPAPKMVGICGRSVGRNPKALTSYTVTYRRGRLVGVAVAVAAATGK